MAEVRKCDVCEELVKLNKIHRVVIVIEAGGDCDAPMRYRGEGVIGSFYKKDRELCPTCLDTFITNNGIQKEEVFKEDK